MSAVSYALAGMLTLAVLGGVSAGAIMAANASVARANRRQRLAEQLRSEARHPSNGVSVLEQLDVYRRLRDIACTHTGEAECPTCDSWVATFDLMAERMLTGRVTPTRHRPGCTRDRRD